MSYTIALRGHSRFVGLSLIPLLGVGKIYISYTKWLKYIDLWWQRQRPWTMGKCNTAPVARIIAELRNRNGKPIFQTHGSGPMLGTTNCIAVTTSTLAGGQIGSKLKSHSPALQKDCNTNMGVPAGSHETQVVLKCSVVDTNKMMARGKKPRLLADHQFSFWYANCSGHTMSFSCL